MAPHSLEPTEEAPSYDINLPYKPTSEKGQLKHAGASKYPQYLPKWEPVFFPPCPEFDFLDPALRADKDKRTLLKDAQIKHISPKMGSELSGVQLSSMSDAAKDELALLVSERKCVVLRDQDFADWGPASQQNFAEYFGKPNYQPVTGSVPGFPAFHIIHRDGNQAEIDKFFEHKLTSTLWHQDVSYERQPPGYVILCILQAPEVGGDTVFASTTEAYNRLSPGFQSMLEDLRATHSSEKMCNFARANGGLCRKDPIRTSHPIVRVHPVTGEKSLFVNGEFIRGIDGWKDPESDILLNFLTDHITKGHDFQVRLSWEPKSVVIFDNRTTCHTATVDYDARSDKDRHMFRLAPMAEVPIPAKK
ncbi:hypothetical protein B9Z19DRAFT_996566 [Tuber borchii]|uniref:TauD/TfdA-like domain-containing protein n=1 Tax=Tuber borchii TaxID=42251 RepID=A0A2T6ZHU3_TUBBO|nr:hypothetical protein B9Z19DRAFT_996566 [Tuber borchii]